MQKTLTRLALALAVLVLGLSLSPQGVSQARAGFEAPWCAVYSEASIGARNCGFFSFAQCMATIQGIGGLCLENANYPERVTPQRKPRKPAR